MEILTNIVFYTVVGLMAFAFILIAPIHLIILTIALTIITNND